MKCFLLEKANKIVEKDFQEPFDSLTSSKIKITKAMITLADVLRYNGKIDVENVILGSYGIGVVSEPGTNFFDFNRGTRVYINPSMPCGNCYNCLNNESVNCSDLKIAGEDYDGYLRNFATVPFKSIYPLPDSVSDLEALFIEYISRSITIIDELSVKKGDHVVVIGGNNFGNILCQLLIYYQAVPILVDNDEENINIAKKSGVYYTLGKDENLVKEVSAMSGGTMADSVVYITDCDISPRVAFSLAGYKRPVAFTGVENKNSNVSFTLAMKKQLKIVCVNYGFGNTATAINLLANRAFNLKNLKVDDIKFEKVSDKLKELAESIDVEEKINETIVTIE